MKIESLAGEVREDEIKHRHSDESELSSRTVASERLKDLAQRPGAVSQKSTVHTKAPVVTDIRQGVRNPNRANIFIDGKFSFSLDITQIVDFKLKIGKELTEDELEELKHASDFGKLYQRTLEWVLTRPRSIRETRDYLRRKIYDKKLDPIYSDRIIERLTAKGYLDDTSFAAYYVENRFVKKGISQKRLRLELAKKGITPDLIEQTLANSPRDEVEEAKKIIAKKRKKYPDDDKLIQYLCRQGFSYQLVRSLIQDSETD